VQTLRRRWRVLVFLLAALGPGFPGLCAAAAPRYEAAASDAPPGLSGGMGAKQGEWRRLELRGAIITGAGLPVVSLRKARHLRVELYQLRDGVAQPLAVVATLPAFSGEHDQVHAVPGGLAASAPLYAHVTREAPEATGRFEAWPSTLDAELRRGAEHSRMIALACGALLAMAVTAALIWIVLADHLLLYYAGLFSLQALYIVYLSGQGFDWPVLSGARAVGSHAWNVPAALSGAIACLFVREIAELRRFSPQVYRVFGVLAGAFVVVAASNALRNFGIHTVITLVGNLLFAGVALFTLIVAALAWYRGIRAAGWFLLAWVLLETLTILVALRLIVAAPQAAEGLLYYGLPMSMVAAAILIALGVADRLREQRMALTVAERNAQTDALTGVLNRRALIDRLEAACGRARTRGLPISLLFIDLDHFKQINDGFGHAAGDACLRAVVAPIQAELRQSDAIGRLGGEEFVVILSSADSSAALQVAERIRARVADLRISGYGADITMTCSIGVASSDRLQIWGEGLIARADEAVYRAKRGGRDQVQCAEPGAV
jgi:diguanylate cyclase (GGDEF)-like protein